MIHLNNFTILSLQNLGKNTCSVASKLGPAQELEAGKVHVCAPWSSLKPTAILVEKNMNSSITEMNLDKGRYELQVFTY